MESPTPSSPNSKSSPHNDDLESNSDASFDFLENNAASAADKDALCRYVSRLIPPPNPLLNKAVPTDESLFRTFKINSAFTPYFSCLFEDLPSFLLLTSTQMRLGVAKKYLLLKNISLKT